MLSKLHNQEPRHRPGYVIRSYIDSVDFDEESWQYPTTIYPELIDFKKYGKNCITDCGVYRLEIKVIEALSGDQVRAILQEI